MKKILTIIILALTLFVSINPVYIYASAEEKSEQEKIDILSMPKQNLEIIEGNVGDTYLSYKYDSDGEKFKVVEKADDDLSEVYSTIYIKNSNGEYEEYATQEFTSDERNTKHTTHLDTESVTSSQTIQSSSASHDEFIPQIDTEPSFSINGLNGTCYGYATGGWRTLHVNTPGSTRIASYTVTAIAGAMTAAVTASVPAVTGLGGIAVVGGVTTLAMRIAQDAVPVLYYYTSGFDLRIANPPVGLTNFTVGLNATARWFTHSSRGSNFHVGNTSDYIYHSCHSPR